MSQSLSLVRIAGTAYGCSTVLDLMLANADNASSRGEIDALFRPYRRHHFLVNAVVVIQYVAFGKLSVKPARRSGFTACVGYSLRWDGWSIRVRI